MGCRRYRKALSEAAAETLAPERRRKLDEHLAQCAECSARLDRLQRARVLIHDALAESATAEPSHEWLRRVEQRLTEQREPHGPRISYWVVAAATAGVLAAIVAAWTLRGRIVPQPAPAPMTSVARPTTPPVTTRHEAGAKAETFEASTPVHNERVARAHRGTAARRESAADARFFAAVKVRPEKEAVARLYELLQSREIDPRSLLTPARAEGEPMTIAPLRIKPISIPPLEVGRDSRDQQGRGTEAGTNKETKP
ncbi:MAG: zf-HC2 domain-containing protein [Acidobacteriota bacterium]|nr:zf-HC2 domain-containing protein [Acidobacteriota bacterium]